MESFDKNAEAIRKTIEGLNDQQLTSEIAVAPGIRKPLVRVLQGRGLVNHLLHHRGQLSVYLRLLDVPVPGMYGPSADEK